MDKREFTVYLKRQLRRLGEDNVQDAIAYYDEIISEKMREGISETQAVASLGDRKRIVAETASVMVAANKIKNPSRGIFLVLGTLMFSPLLFPLVLSAFIVYVVIFSLWAAFSIGFGGAAIASVFFGSLPLYGGRCGRQANYTGDIACCSSRVRPFMYHSGKIRVGFY